MPSRLSSGSLLLLLCPVLLMTSQAGPKRLVVLGDSITAGYGLDKEQAYPALLQAKFDSAKEAWAVVNGGVSGDTTAGGLRRLPWLLREKTELLLIALGGNDGLRGLKLEQTRENLAKMIDLAREKQPGIMIIIAGMRMPDNMGEDYKKGFAEIFRGVAKEKGAGLLPFLLEGVGGEAKLNQEDRIHPNEEGQKILAETVWKSLRQALDAQPPKP